MNIREIQTPNLVYSDDTGNISLLQNMDRLWLIGNLYNDMKYSTIKHYKKIIDELDIRLIQRGIKEYYIYVDSPETFRFGKFLGFEFTNECIKGHRELEIMRKIL